MIDAIFPGLTSAPNLHPLVVHFPIAFWLGCLLFWSIGVVRRSDQAWLFGRWLLYLGTLGGVVAVAAGFWATEQMGHGTSGHDLVHTHRDLMLVTSGLALVITVLAFIKRQAGPPWRLGLLVSIGITVGVMTLGADRGAELVFRYGVGVAGEAPPEVESPRGHGHDDGHEHDH